MALETSVITPKRGRMAVIEAEADIRRSPEEVFDYCSDPLHEPEWNIRAKRIEKVTDGPASVGTRYRMRFTAGPPIISECVRYDRPNLWELAGRSKAIRGDWRGRVVPDGDGAHLVLRMEIQLPGVLGLATPLVRRRMRPELERGIATIKATLEGSERGSVHPL
jgi:Polyketide cyclase / dehydrase and lipid transport